MNFIVQAIINSPTSPVVAAYIFVLGWRDFMLTTFPSSSESSQLLSLTFSIGLLTLFTTFESGV